MYDVLPGWDPSQHQGSSTGCSHDIRSLSRSLRFFAICCGNPWSCIPIPASRGSRRLANLTRYNTGDGAEFRGSAAHPSPENAGICPMTEDREHASPRLGRPWACSGTSRASARASAARDAGGQGARSRKPEAPAKAAAAKAAKAGAEGAATPAAPQLAKSPHRSPPRRRRSRDAAASRSSPGPGSRSPQRRRRSACGSPSRRPGSGAGATLTTLGLRRPGQELAGREDPAAVDPFPARVLAPCVRGEHHRAGRDGRLQPGTGGVSVRAARPLHLRPASSRAPTSRPAS